MIRFIADLFSLATGLVALAVVVLVLLGLALGKREVIVMKFAWLLPRDVALWCFYRVLAHATQGKWSDTEVSKLPWQVAAERWRVQ